MGSEAREHKRGAARQASGEVLVKALPRTGGGTALEARKGEVIGLTGLAGHGQTRMLLQIYERREAEVKGALAFIAGDRQSDGMFNLWSIGQNITVRSLKALRKAGLIDLARGGEAGRGVEGEDGDPHAGRGQQHPDAVRRQPAEGAVRAGARLGCGDHPDGRPDARRRHRHQAGSLCA